MLQLEILESLKNLQLKSRYIHKQHGKRDDVIFIRVWYPSQTALMFPIGNRYTPESWPGTENWQTLLRCLTCAGHNECCNSSRSKIISEKMYITSALTDMKS